MAKTPKSTSIATVDGKTADVGRFEITAELASYAQSLLHIDLTGSHDERANLAAEHMNRSQRHMLAAGLLLASIKAECEHGEFTELVEARGFEERAARKAMQYAQFVLSQPEADRLRLLEMPRSKVMEIAGADPEVIEQLLTAEGGESIDMLSVRALRDRIRELEAATTDLQVQRDTAETEAEGLRKKLSRGLPDRTDGVPLVVADLRAEVSALSKKAGLALDSFGAVMAELETLSETEAGHDWADATLRLLTGALCTLQVQLTGVLKTAVRNLPGEDPTPVPLSRLTAQEVLDAAQRHHELTQVHEYEKRLREWQREQERPRSKGRPSAKPEAPKGVEA